MKVIDNFLDEEEFKFTMYYDTLENILMNHIQKFVFTFSYSFINYQNNKKYRSPYSVSFENSDTIKKFKFDLNRTLYLIAKYSIIISEVELFNKNIDFLDLSCEYATKRKLSIDNEHGNLSDNIKKYYEIV